MYSCKRAAQVLCESQERELGLIEKIRMRMMLTVCEATRRFKRQMEGIDEMAQKHNSEECCRKELASQCLADDTKDRLKAALAAAEKQ